MSSRIVLPPILQEREEVFGPSLLEKTHQTTPHSLHLGSRDFGYFAITINETSSDDFEFHVSSHIGVNENTGEFT